LDFYYQQTTSMRFSTAVILIALQAFPLGARALPTDASFANHLITRGKTTASKSSKSSAPAKGPYCVSKRDLEERGSRQCNQKVMYKKKEYTLDQELGEGADGQVFTVKETVDGRKAVAKVFANPTNGAEECKRAAAPGVKQLIGSEEQADKVLIGFMEHQNGVKLPQWPVWNFFFKEKTVSPSNKAQCKTLMTALRKEIAKKVVSTSTGQTWYNDDFANVGNILIEGESEHDMKINIVDWGKVAQKNGISDAALEALVIKHLETSKLPYNVFKKTPTPQDESSNNNAFSDASCDPSAFGPNPWARRRL
jgi:hypothetical protein